MCFNMYGTSILLLGFFLILNLHSLEFSLVYMITHRYVENSRGKPRDHVFLTCRVTWAGQYYLPTYLPTYLPGIYVKKRYSLTQVYTLSFSLSLSLSALSTPEIKEERKGKKSRPLPYLATPRFFFSSLPPLSS
ncbi:hypothetical protein F5X99DRAFT_277561 [Biscogniauxia marginata]|nr:hypothetical protein F5X99DRAFT_277561 [Biscogniauxia marginata]